MAKAFSTATHQILLAGDSPGDVKAGRAACAKTAAVLWAAFRPDRLRNAGADFVCATVDEFEAVIDLLQAPD